MDRLRPLIGPCFQLTFFLRRRTVDVPWFGVGVKSIGAFLLGLVCLYPLFDLAHLVARQICVSSRRFLPGMVRLYPLFDLARGIAHRVARQTWVR